MARSLLWWRTEEEFGLNMGMKYQNTLGREVHFEGVGLHSGARIAVRLKPARPNSGIHFKRMDIPGQPTIAARYHHVVDTRLATTIGNNGILVSTIEHLMAAFWGAGIDNALVEIDGSEVPILDGSAAPYLEILKQGGLGMQASPRRYLRVQRTIMVREGDAYIKAMPADHFSVTYSIDFPHPLVGKQEYFYGCGRTSFGREIAQARTFGFLRDVEKLQSMGLARGGSLENALVFDDYRILNRDGFRYSDECVRHKILDFMGDLSLAGMSLAGRFEVFKAGHSLHNRFLRELFNRPSSYGIFMSPAVQVPFFQHARIPGLTDRFQAVGHPL
jgi:UDP-3-O-[3-hydroxymyristoyl] N-acetylglucosamine deacetylase